MLSLHSEMPSVVILQHRGRLLNQSVWDIDVSRFGTCAINYRTSFSSAHQPANSMEFIC
jgi:hypothetical protein